MRQAYDHWQDQPGFAGGRRKALAKGFGGAAPKDGGGLKAGRAALERLEHVEWPPKRLEEKPPKVGRNLPGWRDKGWKTEAAQRRLEGRPWRNMWSGFQRLEEKPGWTKVGRRRRLSESWKAGWKGGPGKVATCGERLEKPPPKVGRAACLVGGTKVGRRRRRPWKGWKAPRKGWTGGGLLPGWKHEGWKTEAAQ